MRKSFRHIEKYRKAKLSAERPNVAVKHAPLKICLVFPNTYHVGMSNLAVHSLYGLMNARSEVLCERSFCEDPLTGYSLESGSSLADFDIVAFSVSFEMDFPKILDILAAAAIPLLSSERGEQHPLIIAGGPCIFSNPEPLADFIDLLAVGEGEELIADILSGYSENRRRGRNRAQLIEALSEIPGTYVPSYYDPIYGEDGRLAEMGRKKGPELPVSARVVEELDRYACSSVILTAETEFANMFLIELGRGCRRGCKFCSACYTYYRRHRSYESVVRQLEQAGELGERIGLVTSDLSDYAHRERLLNYLVKKNKAFSVSSIRADALTDDVLAGMRKSSQKTLTLAPEVASEKLMSLTGKRITAATLLDVVERALRQEIFSFRLYFMIGFPGENDEDVRAIARLAAQVHQVMQATASETGKIGRLTVSVNPFVPKPFTPMEAEPFADQNALVRKIRILRDALARIGNTALIAQSARMAKLQCAFARGDRRAGLLVQAAAGGTSITQVMRQYADLIERYVGTQDRPGMRPWHVILPPSAQKNQA